MKKILKLIIRIFIVAVIVGGIVLFSVYKKYEKALSTIFSESSEKIEFVIEAGSSADQIIDSLAQAELIPEISTQYLKIYFRLADLPAMQEGVFSIPKNLTPMEVIDTLQNPESTDVWVTIQEGLRKDEIGDILASDMYESTTFVVTEFTTLTTDIEFIATLELGVAGLTELEGYLYPDKYLFPIDSTAQDIIEVMVQNMKDKVGVPTYEQMIIASMLEREGKTNDDRPMIADIINRRMEEGWLLQIDATLLYYHKDWKHVITTEDKTLNHPYNSYLKLGLPPTPIANPGSSAISATMNPTPNTYYYYIHDDTGQAHFAQTLSEHNLNVETYLR